MAARISTYKYYICVYVIFQEGVIHDSVIIAPPTAHKRHRRSLHKVKHSVFQKAPEVHDFVDDELFGKNRSSIINTHTNKRKLPLRSKLALIHENNKNTFSTIKIVPIKRFITKI